MELSELINEMSSRCKSLDLLYVEDDKSISSNTVETLSPFFNSITVAYNGAEGLVAYKSNDFDIVLTDMVMPVLNGVEMAKEIRKINPLQSIIVMSAFESTENFRQFIEIGISKFIPKPFTIVSLFDGLSSVAVHINNAKEVVRLTETLKRNLNETQSITKLGDWHLNLNTGLLEWSDEIYRLFEIDPALHEPTYEGFLNGIHPEDRDMVNAAYLESVKNHTTYNYVHRLLMDDGRIKYVREQGKTIYDHEGKASESFGTVHNITEEVLLQKSLEEKNTQLIEASSRLELATQSAGIGIWVWNIQDNMILWDRRMFEMYLEDNAPKSMYITYDIWKNACHPDDALRAEEALFDAVNHSNSFNTTFRIIQPSGKVLYIHATAIVNDDAHGKPNYMVGINRDVTNDVLLEETLIKAKESAERSNKIKSDFLANMSHEIRTPLNGVIGLTELLLQTDLQPLQREYLNKSDIASRALLSVLNNILDYSKIEANKLALESIPFNLNDMVNDLVAMLSYKAEQKHLTLETHIDENVPRMLTGDPLRLQQILINLTVNALKFTEKGYVRITIASVPQEKQEKLIFTISDSGIGMSEEEQTTLFQAFSQVDTSFTRKYGGSGLGLMITKKLVELMQGDLSVKSRLGEGSTFTFTALFDYAQQVMDEMSKKILPLPLERQIHLLLVEDNDLNQLVASEHLKQMGITYSIANNGAEAVEMVQKEVFDAVLMDLQMPVMDGLEATRRIRKLGFVNLPIIALSAAVLQDDLNQAQESGMNDFVAKPIVRSILQNVLAKWVNNKTD